MNSNNKIYDVIVVGAGPAGLSTALECAKRGLKVLLIEESKTLLESERSWATCEETIRDYNLEDAVTKIVDSLKFFSIYNFAYGERKNEQSLNKYGGCLVEQARMNTIYQGRLLRHDASIVTGKRFAFAKRTNNLIKIYIEDGLSYTTKIVADCTGTPAVVAKSLNLPDKKYWQWDLYFVRIHHRNEVVNPQMVIWSTGISISKAGSLYPMTDNYYDIGVADYSRSDWDRDRIKINLQRKLKNLWNFYKKHNLIRKEAKFEFKETFYDRIRITPRKKIYDDNLILVGDSAGQGSPLTGEGLRAGLYYGRIAGKAIHEAIKTRNYSSKFLKRYSELCKKNSLFDYKWGLRVQKIVRDADDYILSKIMMDLQKIYNKRGIGYAINLLKTKPIKEISGTSTALRYLTYFTSSFFQKIFKKLFNAAKI